MAIIVRSVVSNFLIGQSPVVNNMTTFPIYGTVEKADAYFSTILEGMRWEDTPRDRKVRALVSATKAIDLLNFGGVKAVDTQPLQFPRGTDTLVPVDIEEATYELALALLRGINPDTERDNLYKMAQAYGPVKTDYDRGAAPLHIVNGIPSPTAWNKLLPYLEERRALILRRVD